MNIQKYKNKINKFKKKYILKIKCLKNKFNKLKKK